MPEIIIPSEGAGKAIGSRGDDPRERLLPPLWVLTLLVTALVLWLLWSLKELVSLLVVGYCLAYLMDKLLDPLERWKVRRTSGFFIVCLAALAVTLILAVSAAPTIVRQYGLISENLDGYIAAAKDRITPLVARAGQMLPDDWTNGQQLAGLVRSLPSVSGEAVGSIFNGIMSTLLRGYSITLTFVNLFLLPFIVFYLAVDFDAFHRFVRALLPYELRGIADDIATEIDQYVSAFVSGQLLIATILTALYAIGLAIIGVDLWFLLALIAGYGSVIPYFGLIVGTVLASLMALVTFGDFSHVLYVWIVFTVAQLICDNLVTPKILGDRVGLSPLVVILAVVAGGKLFGLLGVVLAVPGAAVVRVIMSRSHRWFLQRSGVVHTDLSL